MIKIEIDYDFIDKIHESEGKYKLKRYIKEHKVNDAIIMAYSAFGIGSTITGTFTIKDAIEYFIEFYAASGVVILFTEYLAEILKLQQTGKTRRVRADDELRKLAVQLNDLNISINSEELKEAFVYHKKYHLRMDGKVGIIRDRYIEIPKENNIDDSINDLISIKEEHIIGTKKYVLTLDKPKKEMVYKKAYNM